MKILAISGSLRLKSTNTTLLRALALVSPRGVEVSLYEGLGALPMFNPDIEATDPLAVAKFREQIANADAIVIASPEYAHGVTGVLKNALDWMVGSEAFVNKPVAIFNASSRALHAKASLKETLAMMSAYVVDNAATEIDLIGSPIGEEEIVADPQKSAVLRDAIAKLCVAVASERSQLK